MDAIITPSAPPPAEDPTLKQQIDRYVSTRLPLYATKVGRVLIELFVKAFRFVKSLFWESLNR